MARMGEALGFVSDGMSDRSAPCFSRDSAFRPKTSAWQRGLRICSVAAKFQSDSWVRGCCRPSRRTPPFGLISKRLGNRWR